MHEILELQTHVSKSDVEERGLSITQLWEEELASRFRITSFRPLQAGLTLQSGRFRIIRQLAFGGFSATYLAQYSKRDLVVIKEAAYPQGNDQKHEDSAQYLGQQEVSLLIKLNHPGIAQVIDHFVEQGRRYLVIQYIPGQDLRRFARENGPQPEPKVVAWGQSICEILQYLHGQSPPIIHLDITPENLLLRRDGQVFLIDFGSALEYKGECVSIVSGKRSYMAPEQVKLKPSLQSDIFSLGSTLYYLLTGQDPVPLQQISSTSFPKEISSGLKELIVQSTAYEQSERIPSIQVFQQELDFLSNFNLEPQQQLASRRAFDA